LLVGRVSRRNAGRRDQQRQSDHHGADTSHSNFLLLGVVGGTTSGMRGSSRAPLPSELFS
jgi:hypothetical protein